METMLKCQVCAIGLPHYGACLPLLLEVASELSGAVTIRYRHHPAPQEKVDESKYTGLDRVRLSYDFQDRRKRAGVHRGFRLCKSGVGGPWQWPTCNRKMLATKKQTLGAQLLCSDI